jgi:lipoprotein-anchoring transpeptidase ErfK/SrfK
VSRTQATWMAAIATGIIACAAPASAADGTRADAPSVSKPTWCPSSGGPEVRLKPDATGFETSCVARRVVVSIPDRKLALIDGDQIISIYPIAVGAPLSPSPVGTFSVVTRVTNPTYYRPGKVVGPGAGNPIGTRWIGLSVKGFGIHGTNDPRSIGFAKSHGCIRLRNQDVERLFEQLRAGDVVELHAERTSETLHLFGR